MDLKEEIYNMLYLYTEYEEKKEKLKEHEWILIKALRDYLGDFDFNSIYCTVSHGYEDFEPFINIEIDFKDEDELEEAVKTLKLFRNPYNKSYANLEVHVYLTKQNIQELLGE